MNTLLEALPVIGILSTAVVSGTDVPFRLFPTSGAVSGAGVKSRGSFRIVLGESSRHRRAHENQALSTQPAERTLAGACRDLHVYKMRIYEMKPAQE